MKFFAQIKLLKLCEKTKGLALMQKSQTLGLLLVLFFIFPISIFSAESPFTISVVVVDLPDTTPPSIPTGLSATAISTSQIDLSWTASTDNVAVTGYRVYRNSSLVTTTVGTAYSDTGLSSATSYDYTVSAIDLVENESAQSATSTATTQSAPVPPPAPTTPTGGGRGPPVPSFPYILSFTVNPRVTSAIVSWETDVDTKGVLSWGQTFDSEIGNIVEVLYKKKHSTTIPNLAPNTTYYLSLTVTSALGGKISTQKKIFTTAPLPITELPVNVTNFTLTPFRSKTPSLIDDIGIAITWNNPSAINFDVVRIVRSTKFYPSDPTDGKIIFEGRGDNFVDKNIQEEVVYYYTIFARDTRGVYSSGSVTKTSVRRDAVQTPVTGQIVLVVPADKKINSLQFSDFDFYQDGKLLFREKDIVYADAQKGIAISVLYKKLPDALKTMLVIIKSQEDSQKIIAFLLRADKEKTMYQGAIAPVEIDDMYQIEIFLFDYKNQELKKITGSLLAQIYIKEEVARKKENTILGYIKEKPGILLIASLFILLLLLLIVLFLKRKKEEIV